MLMWVGTDLVTANRISILVLILVLHLTTQITEQRSSRGCSARQLRERQQQQRSSSYLSTSVWSHNRYSCEFWKAKHGNLQCVGLYYNTNDQTYITENHKLCMGDNRNCRKSVSDNSVHSVELDNLSTSVWCHTSLESGLRCHFQHLYYSPQLKEYIFVIGPRSIIYGIEDIKSLQNKLFLSSAIGHNAFSFQVSILPLDAFLSSYISKLIKGKSFFVARFKPDNLHHVFHDDLMPIYFTMRELCGEVEDCLRELLFVIHDTGPRNLYWPLYQALSSKIMLLSELEVTDKRMWYCFENAYFGVSKLSIWYQYGFGKPQGPQLTSSFSGHLLREFADFMREKLALRPIENGVHKVIIISRKLNRRMLNEHELDLQIRKYLKTHFKESYVVKIVSLDDTSVGDIISELSEACLAIGMHGAGLILGIFLPPGSVLVELWPYGVNPNVATVYKTMCNLKGFGVAYVPWVNEDEANTIYHSEYPSHLGGLGQLVTEERDRVIKRLHEGKIEALECCDNPNWLFRIYQDTIVLLSDKEEKYKSVPFDSLLYRVFGIELFQETSTNNLLHHLYPSKVQNFKYYISDDNFKNIIMEWTGPWNIDSLQCETTSYEIVILSDGENILDSVFVKTEQYVKDININIGALSVWITCFCNDTEGSELYVSINI